MESLVLQPTSTAQWHALVNEAELSCSLELGEDLQSYLVFLLMRYTSKPEIAMNILAMEFLEGMQSMGTTRTGLLQDLGDKCLLFAGLFPERAKRRRVNVSYFVDLGQTAYHELSQFHHHELSKLYNLLCERFPSMQNVLHAMRHEYVFSQYQSLEVPTSIDPFEISDKTVWH